ncbi:MAG: FHIPEP family type III secretion protein [Deltaproteobacteria bacterium]|nr:FHIPEP family type III secretion protein [Deltaproteobacteria bacterium]
MAHTQAVAKLGYHHLSSQYGRLILVIVVMAILTLMIIPLSPFMLDFMLVISIVSALTILMMTLSITDSLKFSSFPALILISAIFRLSLNVSSTRLVLSEGEAGAIIRTFGYFVTGGNLLVGIIIFLILLIIQFLVVAKGSERVAEVAARFTLDALPGKQMSIDADLRAGVLTTEDAALRRSELIKESRFYGAMDGAMKFVKGEVLAGFVITFINMAGGLCVGIFQRGMDIGLAAQKYSMLTVGDGLVAQIPALLVSVSSGLIVTRVSDFNNRHSLGSEIGQQILSQPSVLFIVSAVTLLMALVPGFPALLLLGVSLGLFMCGLALTMYQKTSAARLSLEDMCVDKTRCDDPGVGHVHPLTLELGKKIYHSFLTDKRWQHFLQEMYPKIRNHLSHKTGVPLPHIVISCNEELKADSYTINVYEIPVEDGVLSTEHDVVRLYARDQFDLDLNQGEKRSNTVHGTPVLLLHPLRRSELVQKGIKYMSPEEVLLRHVAKTLKKHAASFTGIQQVSEIIAALEQTHPELVREVVPRQLTINKLTEIVRRLLDEGVSIRNFGLILEVLARSRPEGKNSVDLCEIVRMGLSREISHGHINSDHSISCFMLDPAIESEIADHIQKDGEDCFLALPPERITAICDAVKAGYKAHGLKGPDAVILTHTEIRRYVRRLIEGDLPDVAVLSYQELAPTIRIDRRDTISL